MRYLMILSIMTMVFIGTAFGQNGSIQVGGMKRSFILHVPSSGLPDNPSFVISLHGLNNNATIQRSWSGFDNVADKEKFIVVYPEAINMSWDLSGTTDVNFIAALIDTMYARYHIDRKRVYATGMSMGGMFSYTLACKAADKIAAIGPGRRLSHGRPWQLLALTPRTYLSCSRRSRHLCVLQGSFTGF